MLHQGVYHMRRLFDQLLPLGIVKRRCYERILIAIRVTINEGWRSFFLER